MKSTELRIGNYITYHNAIISVEGIVKNCIYYAGLCFDSSTEQYHPFFPIELTDEWLLKCGFIDNNYTMDLKIGKRTLSAKWYSKVVSTGVRSGWYLKKYNHVKSVHQLQNLVLSLTGEELKIK